jgi:hypothetical protein
MKTVIQSLPHGEVLPTAIASTTSASAFDKRRFGFGSRNRMALPTSTSERAAATSRYPHSVAFADVEADLDRLVDNAIAAIVDGEPVEDEILGHYVQIASLVRAVSFREGKLLEQAVELLAKANPAIAVLMQSIKLPLVKAAIEAVSGNDWTSLERVTLDSEAPAKGSYTPDLIIVNRARHMAYILDLKRSLASYGDTSRLEELKMKMMASALILPDWLYKQHKRLMVDTVGVAIVDGASRPSDHEHGVWALDEIDDLLEIDGVAVCMAELRLRFGNRVREVLETAARKAIGVKAAMGVGSISVNEAGVRTETSIFAAPARPRINLNAPSLSYDEEQKRLQDHADCYSDFCDDPEPEDDGAGDLPVLPFRIRVGFARRVKTH